jgi:hypothetical protein
LAACREEEVVTWELHQPDGFDGPTEISSWVVKGRLAMGYYPGMRRGGRVIEEMFDELLDSGINQFVNLTQDWEGGTDRHLEPYYHRSGDPEWSPLVRWGSREGEPLDVAFHPVPDEHLPSCGFGENAAWSICEFDGFGEDIVSCNEGRPVPATRLILDAVDGYLAQGSNIYVHCWGGSGRTGTIIGCWIRRHGLAGQHEVLDCLQGLRQGDSIKHGKAIPNTHAQGDLILSWEEGW